VRRPLKDILAGLTFVGFGLAFAVTATSYEIGTPLAMGPGYFPLVVGAILVGVGIWDLSVNLPNILGAA
jgi:hypothetical protein